MPSIEYDTIYKRALSRIDDLELANYTEDDFYSYLLEWLHNALASPFLRKKFSSFTYDDDVQEIEFTLNNSVDDAYDTEFVTSILAKGLILSYLPSKLETTSNLAVMIGGKEEKKLLGNYSKNMERLADLERDYQRELSRHGYYFGDIGASSE